MIYTDSGRYAIRAVTRLAGSGSPRTPMTVAEIAGAEGNVATSYLAKVLQELARVGLLESVRGRGGGFRLSRPPDQIRAIEVLDAVEGLGERTKMCILGLDQCSDTSPCPLHDVWKEFRDSVMTSLRTLTIADLAAARARKRRLLEPAEEAAEAWDPVTAFLPV